MLPAALDGLALAGVLAFLARPLAVFAVLAPLRMPWREQLFVAWVGLRGAVPIVLATYPVLRGVQGGDQIFHLVFFVVLVNSLVPGATVAWLARRLGLAGTARPSTGGERRAGLAARAVRASSAGTSCRPLQRRRGRLTCGISRSRRAAW